MLTAAYRLMQLARTTLLLEQPFFGVLALGLQLVEDASCPTAWTDGRSLGFNPAFVSGLSTDERTALVAHEVMHCACGHPWRREQRTMPRWNQACDYAINALLREGGFTLPQGALIDAAYDGRWAEWIYDRLPERTDKQQSPSQGQGPSQGQSSPDSQPPAPEDYGQVRDAPTESDAPTDAEWQQAVRQAVSSSRGTLPGAFRRSVADLSTPRVDWRSLLRRYVQEVSRADYSWTRPNVRYLASGLYLPSLSTPTMGRIAIAVDTSGSIDAVLLGQFGAEISAIASELQPSSVDVLYCDSKVHRVDTFAVGEPIALDAVGGGGTAFAPVFAHVDDDPPAVLVYLTDLYGSFPDVAPSYPVVWAAYGSRTDAPFGDVVPCE
jgi:predicted metal-dependent peptidase